jgi:mono/diheme cytochrome c family protein
MRILIILIMAASVLWAQAPAQTPVAETAPRGNAENGKKSYVKYGCYQCHGYLAHGGAGGDSLRGGPRIAPQPQPYPSFSKYVRQPTEQMPPYTVKILPDSDLADIYAWLLEIPQPPPVSSIPQLRN